MRLELSPLALEDIETIGDYIAQDSPANAVHFIQGLRAQCEKIVLSPLGYVAGPELGDDIRSCAYGRILHSALDIRDPSDLSEPPTDN